MSEVILDATAGGIRSQITEFGFNFGAAEVFRACSFPDGYVVLVVQTPKGCVEVGVTKTGFIRVYAKPSDNTTSKPKIVTPIQRKGGAE